MHIHFFIFAGAKTGYPSIHVGTCEAAKCVDYGPDRGELAIMVDNNDIMNIKMCLFFLLMIIITIINLVDFQQFLNLGRFIDVLMSFINRVTSFVLAVKRGTHIKLREVSRHYPFQLGLFYVVFIFLYPDAFDPVLKFGTLMHPMKEFSLNVYIGFLHNVMDLMLHTQLRFHSNLLLFRTKQRY